MESTSKDLLDLEQQTPSVLESSFLICPKDTSSQSKNHHTRENISQKLLTTSVPTSQVLGKVKDFLGIMGDANKRLELDAQENSCADYDIEVLTGNEAEYIEMDLVLGVADLHTPEAVAAAELAIAGSQPSIHFSASKSGSDTEDSDVDAEPCSPKKVCKPNFDRDDDSLITNQSKKRPKVTELN
ncbi:uncharacterized protein LOC143881882 [Tasmannia lanceolata]|uniref:uncharacterized protein LOC143881882 n=1 Tax=Tasmannia lanceolata TaxID=3420 RepID=UPI004063F48B